MATPTKKPSAPRAPRRSAVSVLGVEIPASVPFVFGPSGPPLGVDRCPFCGRKASERAPKNCPAHLV